MPGDRGLAKETGHVVAAAGLDWRGGRRRWRAAAHLIRETLAGGTQPLRVPLRRDALIRDMRVIRPVLHADERASFRQNDVASVTRDSPRFTTAIAVPHLPEYGVLAQA